MQRRYAHQKSSFMCYIIVYSADFGKPKAVEAFAKAINSRKFKGIKCESVQDFRAGKCVKNEGVVFGESVDKTARGNYFVSVC